MLSTVTVAPTQRVGLPRDLATEAWTFFSKVNLGTGFGGVDVIVLGQAKCEALDKPTNGVAL